MPDFGYGQMDPNDTADDFGVMSFIVNQILGRISTAKVVQVKAVTAGDSGGPSTVDVQPLVNQLDGQGNSTEHGIIFGIPVIRLQSGAFAVIADPIVGEIGLMLCCDRDISAVKQALGPANPGSYRRFDPADGVYLGALFGAQPTASVQFANGTLTITATTVKVVGNLRTTGSVIAGFGGADQVGLQTHTHTGANVPPTAGT